MTAIRIPTCSKMCLSALLASALLFGSTAISAADYYRWTDDKGVTHFTDKRPTGKNAERVQNRSVRGLRARAPEALAEVNGETREEADARRCTDERQRLSILQSHARIQLQERDGSVRELNPAEIQQEVAVTRRAIERFCR